MDATLQASIMTLPILDLLERLRDKDPTAWPLVDEVYRPMILVWLRKQNVSEQDAEDVTQEVMIRVIQLVGDFQHNGRVGAFRNWLRKITRNVLLNFLRTNRSQWTANSEAFERITTNLEGDAGEFVRNFNREHDQFVLSQIVTEVSDQFAPQTIEVFRRYCLGNEPPEDIAVELGINVNMVYVARNRVLEKLKERTDAFEDLDLR